MKLVADEGVDSLVVTRLREDGHEVHYVAEMTPGIGDDQLLDHANLCQALLITTDKDFGELVFRQGKLHSGIVLLRLAGVSPSEKAEIVAKVLAMHESELRTAFSVITNKILRIRPRQ